MTPVSTFLLGTDAPAANPADLRLLGPAVGIWLCTALLLGSDARTAAVVGAVLVGVAAVLAPVLRSPFHESWAVPVVAVLICAAGGALATGGRLAAVESSPVAALAEQETPTTMAVVITGDPRPRAKPLLPGRAEYVIDARSEWAEVDGVPFRSRVPVVVLASGPRWRGLLPGQEVRLSGKVVPAGDGGLVGGLVLVRGPPERTAPPPPSQAWAGMVRARLREASAALPAPARGLLPAMVVGDVSGLDRATAEAFRDTGMTHLLTVSGANLSVLTGVALGIGRWSRWPPWGTTCAGAVMIAVFVLVARPEPSVLRAAFMGGIALLALALGRQRAGFAALAAAVVALLLFDPGLARSYGFALSVSATGGIMVLAPGWRDRWSARLPRWLAEAVAVSLAAHVACAPVLVLVSAEVSWIAVPANVVATPLMPIATTGGFAIAGLALVWPAAAAVLVWIPGAVVIWVSAVAAVGARVPHGAVPWRGDLAGAGILAVLLILLLAVRGRPRRIVLSLGAAVVAAGLVVHCAAPGWPPGRWALVACDIGQGDALALSAGDGRAVLVDTGLDPIAVDRCLTDLGVREIALLVLTHGDADHDGGTSGVLSHRDVRTALVPDGYDSPDTARALDDAAVPVHTAEAGQRWEVPPWTFDVLWPRPGAHPEGNDASIVLLARWTPPSGSVGSPMTVLLTGDIEESAQRALLNSHAIRGVDVLKTPHHGAGTQESAFLAATRPRITLTSVGADNPYGHPAPQTWALLESLTTANYRTDLHGDVAVSPGPNGPSATVRGPRRRHPPVRNRPPGVAC
ncbi:MAG: ComEC/Rec2 family competence protein [Nocardiopsaceae bacterium]|nr:ComEC/Rec2 family competence protein [Nocardiopsaceae bacterium]